MERKHLEEVEYWQKTLSQKGAAHRCLYSNILDFHARGAAHRAIFNRMETVH